MGVIKFGCYNPLTYHSTNMKHAHMVSGCAKKNMYLHPPKKLHWIQMWLKASKMQVIQTRWTKLRGVKKLKSRLTFYSEDIVLHF